MSGIKQRPIFNLQSSVLKHLLKLPLLCAALSLLLLQPVLGQQDTYFNDGSFLCPPQTIPTINATNFFNSGTFEIEYTLSSYLQLFETRNTLNHTNIGTMIANNGFRFDSYLTSSGAHLFASSFNNAGAIFCGTSSYGLSADGYPPQFIVWATNIINSGSVAVGEYPVINGISGTNLTSQTMGGLIQFLGQNVDLSGSSLSIGDPNLVTVNTGISGSGSFGTDTNGDWTPASYLGQTSAISSESSPPSPSFQLILNNSTSYYQVDQTGPSNVLLRAVFVENDTPNVSVNVYIPPYSLPRRTFDYGTDATIEWIGSFVDPSTGNSFSNFCYLNDYALSTKTNVLSLVNKIPVNFTFEKSSTQLGLSGIQTNQFPTNLIQQIDVVTNQYSFATVQMTAVSVGSLNGALTNLPARVQINASSNLNFSSVAVSGVDYFNLTATNQFTGSGNQILSPYSDINVGVTNGSLVVSNLVESVIPSWSGSVRCWSGRWSVVDTNSGMTNEFRVLIVGSQLLPTTPSQVQDLLFHSTNSLVISDTYNILRNFYTDAQNLTLTTNGIGVGSQSLDGELNFQSSQTYWANCVPNLKNLTNNGVINLLTQSTFGSSQTNYNNFINNGIISSQGSQIWANNFVNNQTFLNAAGSFVLKSSNAALGGVIETPAGGVSISTGNLLVSNLVLQAAQSLTLTATNLLTDGGVDSGNFWTVGELSVSGFTDLSLPIKPAFGDLLGTTIMNIAQANKNVGIVWAGNNFGASVTGYTNNAAIGHLIIDTIGSQGKFTVSGTGISNAMYVDLLEFTGSSVSGTNSNAYEFTNWLNINTNMVIYFADAVINGVSIAQQIDSASRNNGKNKGRLLWVPAYAGHFTSTSIVVGGVTNIVNSALISNNLIDSNGDGIPNASDPNPFFTASQISFVESITNVPPLSIRLMWKTIPNALNYVYFKTNLLSTNWTLLSTNSTMLANPFLSPIPYPSPATNIWILDPINIAQPKYYQIVVQPWLTYPY